MDLIAPDSGGRAGDNSLRTITKRGRAVVWELQLIEDRSQADDQPVSASCPETRYLKCLMFAVRYYAPANQPGKDAE